MEEFKHQWLILGPGRSGSKVIVDILRKHLVLRYANGPQYIGPENIFNGSSSEVVIVHSHNPDSLQFYKNKNFNVVISTRNMVESALSWAIREFVGPWHIYETSVLESIKVKKNYVPLDVVKMYYDNIVFFYSSIFDSVDNTDIIIDYSEFKNNITKINEILNIPLHSYIKHLPKKNPGLHSDWIENWEEISNYVENLSEIPILPKR